MTMRKCFKTGGGFGVWIEDEEVPAASAESPETPAEPVPDEDEEVPPEGDCDGCAAKPSNQPPSVP